MRTLFGLLYRDMDYIEKALTKFKEIDKAVVFGSRAIGNYKPGSDVDIAIFGKAVTEKTLYDLNDLLNEQYPLPYYFDLLYYEKINNEKLKKHIETVGKELYSKK